MKIKDFLETEEYKLIKSVITHSPQLGDNAEFVRAYFVTSKFYKDNDLIEEIIDLLDVRAAGDYQREIHREFTVLDCNTLLHLMKMSSPHDFHNFIEWSLCSARAFWTENYYLEVLKDET
jgi:hypothetical protein